MDEGFKRILDRFGEKLVADITEEAERRIGISQPSVEDRLVATLLEDGSVVPGLPSNDNYAALFSAKDLINIINNDRVQIDNLQSAAGSALAALAVKEANAEAAESAAPEVGESPVPSPTEPAETDTSSTDVGESVNPSIVVTDIGTEPTSDAGTVDAESVGESSDVSAVVESTAQGTDASSASTVAPVPTASTETTEGESLAVDVAPSDGEVIQTIASSDLSDVGGDAYL